MFYFRNNKTLLGGAFTTAELIFHAVVRDIRTQHSNAVVAIIRSIVQVLAMVLVFYLIMSFMGTRVAKVRGDIVLYLLSGVFLFMLHIKSVKKVAGVGAGNNPMMLHSPMNMVITIVATALGTLYTMMVTMFIILFLYHAAVKPLVIEQPGPAFAMVLLSWFTGCAVGLVLMALRPWFPMTAGILTTVYRRLQMIFSGKMFLANALGGYMLMLFAWNPLFHLIDQCRGYVFRNYYPRNTSWEYAVWVGVALLMIGLLGVFFTKKHVSQSWSARR